MGFLGGFIPIIGVALVNYFKIQLRADPFLAVDLGLASEAAGIVGHYQLELNWLIWLTVAALVAGLVFSILLMPKGIKGWPVRMLGALSAGALLCVSFVSIYLNDYEGPCPGMRPRTMSPKAGSTLSSTPFRS